MSYELRADRSARQSLSGDRRLGCYDPPSSRTHSHLARNCRIRAELTAHSSQLIAFIAQGTPMNDLAETVRASMAGVPDLGYKPVPDPFKLPSGLNFGPCSGVAVNSKGNILVFNRSANALLEFDATGKFLRYARRGNLHHPARAARGCRRQHLGHRHRRALRAEDEPEGPHPHDTGHQGQRRRMASRGPPALLQRAQRPRVRPGRRDLRHAGPRQGRIAGA